MGHPNRDVIWIIGLTTSLMACGGSPTERILRDLDEVDLNNEATVRELATATSAPVVHFYGQAGAPPGDPEIVCPEVRESADGMSWTVRGGCTDADGVEYFGTARYTFSGDFGEVLEPVEITLDGAGRRQTVDCLDGGTTTEELRATGTMQTRSDDTFELDMAYVSTQADLEACTSEDMEIAYVYTGKVELDANGDEVWSGSGEGGFTGLGRVEMRTEGEVLGSACETEAEAGTTTLTAGGHEVVITYDGATDCDEDSTVTWTLDGEDQGEMSGVECSTAGGTAGWIWLAGLALVGLRRRGSGAA